MLKANERKKEREKEKDRESSSSSRVCVQGYSAGCIWLTRQGGGCRGVIYRGEEAGR